MKKVKSSYRLLQQKIKPYKLGGYSSVPLNAPKIVLETEYYRLLQLGFTQDQLEKAIGDREDEKIRNMIYWRVIKQPDLYPLRLIKTKIFQLSHTESTKEFKKLYPLPQKEKLDFRYKTNWIEILRIIEEITNTYHEQQQFFVMVERAIEIELKSKQNDSFRHQALDPDLLSLLRDHHLIGRMWEKEKTSTKSLKRAFVIQRCKKNNLNPEDFYLSEGS